MKRPWIWSFAAAAAAWLAAIAIPTGPGRAGC